LVIYSPEQEARKVLPFFRRRMEMERSPFLPLPEGMIIGQVEITEAQRRAWK
jgi:hypothetical protein